MFKEEKFGPKIPEHNLETIKEWWMQGIYENARLEKRIKELEDLLKQIRSVSDKAFYQQPTITQEKKENCNFWAKNKEKEKSKNEP